MNGRGGVRQLRNFPHSQAEFTHLALASLTRILGRAKSSLNRWLCSVNLLSFSSDIDCLCGREFMVDNVHGSAGSTSEITRMSTPLVTVRMYCDNECVACTLRLEGFRGV